MVGMMDEIPLRLAGWWWLTDHEGILRVSEDKNPRGIQYQQVFIKRVKLSNPTWIRGNFHGCLRQSGAVSDGVLQSGLSVAMIGKKQAGFPLRAVLHVISNQRSVAADGVEFRGYVEVDGLWRWNWNHWTFLKKMGADFLAERIELGQIAQDAVALWMVLVFIHGLGNGSK